MKNRILILVSFFYFNSIAYSQLVNYVLPKITWVTGSNLDFLVGVKKMKVIISYDSLLIMGKPNEEYQQEVADKYEKDVAGKGQMHMDKWHKAKGDLFQRIFLKNILPRFAKMKIKADYGLENADCIMRVYPLRTTVGEPGFPNMISSEQAYCDFRIVFIDPKKNNEIVGNVLALECSGRSTDWDMSFIGRFKNCFTMCGYYLSDDMVLKMREK